MRDAGGQARYRDRGSMRRRSRLVVSFCWLVLGSMAGSARAQPIELGEAPEHPVETRPALAPLPLAITVAQRDGAPVAEDRWIADQIAIANQIFGTVGVSFVDAERHTMGERHAAMESRRDRHRLGGLIHAQRIDIFVVASLRDVDEPSRMRQGVHWRPRGADYPAGAHFVILSAIAGRTVLAHELGHYFGNRHSSTSGNIMSYEGRDAPPFFDDHQAQRIRFSHRRFLAREELVAVEPD